MRLLLILTLFLAGCAHQPEVVQVPVRQPCQVQVPAKPELRYSPGSYTKAYPLVRDLLADRQLMLGYETELEAALSACLK